MLSSLKTISDSPFHTPHKFPLPQSLAPKLTYRNRHWVTFLVDKKTGVLEANSGEKRQPEKEGRQSPQQTDGSTEGDGSIDTTRSEQSRMSSASWGRVSRAENQLFP